MDNQTMLNEVQELLSEEECDLISPVTLDITSEKQSRKKMQKVVK